jgi:hypothetical protein
MTMLAVILRFLPNAAFAGRQVVHAGTVGQGNDFGLGSQTSQRFLQVTFQGRADPEHHIGPCQGAGFRGAHGVAMGIGTGGE